MFDKFNFGKPHTTPEQRLRLAEAILNRDPARFREALQESPPPDDQFRLYGVIVKTERGMTPILVDRDGNPFEGPDAVIPAGTPMDMLNMDCYPNEIVVTIDGEVYRAPVALPHLPPDSPQGEEA